MSQEHRQRLSDFSRMVREQGIPIVIMKNMVPVRIEMGGERDIDREADFGTPEAPEKKLVCSYCGQDKMEFMRFLENIEAANAFRFGRSIKGTRTGGLVRVIEPAFVGSGLLDSPEGFAWGRCPHTKVWRQEFDNAKPRKGRFGAVGRFSCFLLF